MHHEVTLYDRLRENEEIARKFYEVEKKILTILRFKDLFEVLLTEIRNQFNIPYVWLTFIQSSDTLNLLESMTDMDEDLKSSINIIDQTAFFALVGRQTEPILINEDLKPWMKLLPGERNYLVKSMAVAPITMDGEIIGSLNQADASPTRFDPDMDPSLLEQLATKVSLCMSNVTAHEKLKFLAYHDPLTGLLNRRVMEKALAREVNRARRYHLPLSVIFIDLDYFKVVNDTHGHKTGDALLAYLAANLSEKTRETDIVARFAGDEFVIILPETSAGPAASLIDRIKTYLDTSPLIQDDGTAIPVSITYGVASMEDIDAAEENPELLLKKADERLYIKKAARDDIPAESFRSA
ncbi:MAG: diguanylate cyclase [Thermodesulfobacteriota bacterium]|nr:diguanylate cyclase [Thermodesulfobacteriota bacterium]